MIKTGWLYWTKKDGGDPPRLLDYEPSANPDAAVQQIVYHDDDSSMQEFNRVMAGINLYVSMLVPDNIPARNAIASMLVQLRDVGLGNQRPCEQCGIQIPPGFETEAGNGMVFCSGSCYGACVGVPCNEGRGWLKDGR